MPWFLSARTIAGSMLTRIVTAAVLIPLVVLLVLSAPIPVLAIVAGVAALMAVHEFLKMTEAYGVQPFYGPTYIFVILFFVFLAIDPGQGKPLLSATALLYTLGFSAAIAPFFFLMVAMKRTDMATAYPAAAASVFAFVYAAMPVGLAVSLRQFWAGAFLLLYMLLTVWAGDIFAYFTGKAIGRHKMSPHISPNKTWEGAVGSMAGSLLVGGIFFSHALEVSQFFLRHRLIEPRDGMLGLDHPDWITIVGLTVAVNVAAQFGDLVESLIKRGAGIKDSGAILPGHGGMLDRIDAMLFAAPVVWYYAVLRTLQ